MVTKHPLCTYPFLRAWTISHDHPGSPVVMRHREGKLPGQDLVGGGEGLGVQTAARYAWGAESLLWLPRAGAACLGRGVGRGHCSWPAGDGSLWPCHVGFAVGIGEPQKGFEQRRDTMKCGFPG